VVRLPLTSRRRSPSGAAGLSSSGCYFLSRALGGCRFLWLRSLRGGRGIVAHGVEDVEALHAAVSWHAVADGVVSNMTHVEFAEGYGNISRQ